MLINIQVNGEYAGVVKKQNKTFLSHCVNQSHEPIPFELWAVVAFVRQPIMLQWGFMTSAPLWAHQYSTDISHAPWRVKNIWLC